jgi:tRNA A-37 threonylcarbamoyl transferase component Bud32
MSPMDGSLTSPLAHKLLHEQGILHADISYGNMFLSESPADHVYGFLADLDLASVDDKALDRLPEDMANTLREQRGKGP